MIKYLRSLILILLPFSACGMLLGHGIEEAQIDSPIGSGRQGYSGDGQAAVKADLDQPFDVTIDQKGRILFSDTFNHCIRRHDPKNGLIETIAGNGKKGFSGDGGPATEAMLNEPYGIKLSPDDRLLYIVDRLNFRVRRVNLETGTIQTFAGNGKPEYSGDGGPAMIAGLVEPNGVALGPGSNGPASAVYIADVRGHRIRVVETESGVIRTFAGTGKGRHDGDGGPASEASIFGARAVAVGPEGNVYILEREGNSLRVVDHKTGIINKVAGTGKKGDGGDGGPALNAEFNGPKELCVSPDGKSVLIVDTENQKIRRVNLTDGLISTVAGNGTRGGRGDGGAAKQAELDRPHGVAVDHQGVIWIGDTNNHRIRRVFYPDTKSAFSKD